MAAFRHAVYWVPAPGALATWGAGWLGWDAWTGRPTQHPEVPGLPRPLRELTAEPRRYGLHATLKPPFRLAQDQDEAGLARSLAALAATLAPARADALRVRRIGRFLALVPDGGEADLGAVAAAAVARLDAFRARPSEAELARRRAAGLSAEEEANLARWGYPYVMEAFRFHVTLTGPLGEGEAERVEAALALELAGLPLKPFVLDALAHVVEGEDGMFRVVHRYPLSG
jgi:putative phosphonate metabolism protein